MRQKWIDSGVALIAFSTFGLSMVFAAYSTMEAVEENRSATAAMDLRLAAIAVDHADHLRSLGGEISVAEVTASIEVLSNDREAALHALEPVEALEADLLLDQIIEHAFALLDPERTEHPDHEHERLQALLTTATERSSSDAATAERHAALALAATSIVMASAVWLATRSRSRALRDRALTMAQFRAGQQLEVLLNDSPDILLVVDTNDQLTYRSASSANLLEPEDHSLHDLIALTDRADQTALRSHLNHVGSSGSSALFELSPRSSERGWFDVRVSDLTEHPLVGGRLLTIRDVTKEIRLRTELEHQATTDFLTGLPNRRALDPKLDAAYSTMKAQGTVMAVLSIDIDGFKTINDTFGHLEGDELLAQVAARLRTVTRVGETLLRLGGDEFALVICDLAGIAAAELTADRLLEALRPPFSIGDRVEHVRSSIGVATTDDPEHARFLVGEADLALYDAKKRGGDQVVVFESSLESTATRRERITRALRRADYDKEFRLVYQPIVSAVTGEVSSLEALLRWTSPSLGELAPDEFIPIAELTGEICSLGTWVVHQVCKQMADWSTSGLGPSARVAINVSPRQLGEADFVSCMLDITRAWDVDPAKLIVEVTESVAMDESGGAQDRLEHLRRAGFRIAIDDFGAGYSNLGRLLEVPFDIIKIDRSLLLTLSAMREQAGGDPSDPCAIIAAIVSIANILEVPVVCEGVETDDQLESLRASGISHVQGYLTGRPSPPDVITTSLGAKPIEASMTD